MGIAITSCGKSNAVTAERFPRRCAKRYMPGLARTMSMAVMMCLSACSKETTVLAVLPLYESCETILSKHESKLHDLGYDAHYHPVHFSMKPEAHPGLTGYVELSGSLSEIEVSDILNGLKVACLPEDTIQIDVSELALLKLPDTLEDERKMTEQYLSIKDGKITIYQNNSTKSQRGSVVE